VNHLQVLVYLIRGILPRRAYLNLFSDRLRVL
jgi:hypothetical protein